MGRGGALTMRKGERRRRRRQGGVGRLGRRRRPRPRIRTGRRGGPPFEGSRSVSTMSPPLPPSLRLFREDGYGDGELPGRKIHDGRLFRMGEVKIPILMPMAQRGTLRSRSALRILGPRMVATLGDILKDEVEFQVWDCLRLQSGERLRASGPPRGRGSDKQSFESSPPRVGGGRREGRGR